MRSLLMQTAIVENVSQSVTLLIAKEDVVNAINKVIGVDF
jgi:hypothetical protein